ncbi:MAG TPA: FAD-dependent oxidoreductase [Thermomicrobiales bacterium]|nr:FAD-dependent oxidoreductase [Thermomicrobiales bacterium]
METLQYARAIPVVGAAEVLVVGAGPAGLAAAIAAARHGARTLLVERFGFLGGNLTAGLVGPCMTAYSLDGTRQLIRGVFEEFVRRMEAVGGALHPSGVAAGTAYCGFITYGHDKVTPFQPEAAKQVALDLCLEAGVGLLLHTFVADALVDEGAVTGVVVANKSGLGAVRAQLVVDCSADADVAARAGVPCHLGREEDGLTQPMTLFFRVAGVDDEAVRAYVARHPDDYRPFAGLVAAARAAGEFTIPRQGVGLYRTLEPGVWRINTTRIQRVDGTSAADLTRAEVEGRRQVRELLRFFRNWLPGFERCTLLDTAATIGVRETRRIAGEYTLTLDDLATGRAFPDAIALAGYPVDLHSPTGDGGGADGSHPTADAYQIPYRCLVPLGVDNLLVAGRSISATHEALAATRVMPPCFALGEAAGTAAALALEHRTTPRRLDAALLRRALARQGAYLGEPAPAGAATP